MLLHLVFLFIGHTVFNGFFFKRNKISINNIRNSIPNNRINAIDDDFFKRVNGLLLLGAALWIRKINVVQSEFFSENKIPRIILPTVTSY